MISYYHLLTIMIILVFFKSIILILLPGVFVNIFIFFILFCIIFALIWNRQIKLNGFNILLLFTSIFITVLVPVSIFLKQIHPKLVLYAYLRILFVLIIFLIASNIKLLTLNKVVIKIIKIIFLYILIGSVEFLLPVDIKKPIIEWFVLQKIGGMQTSLNMYYFKEFGQEIFRLGSISFEPITFSVISAIGVYLLIELNREKFKIFYYFLINFLTLVKSGIVILMFMFLAKYLKKSFLPIVYLFSFMLATIFFLYYWDIVIELINSDKSYEYIKVFIKNFATVGNHIVGLIMGVVSGLEAPFWGHGLGTAGYIISNEAIKLDIVGPTILNGNESTVGTIVHQIGFIGLFLIFLIFYNLLYAAKRCRDYVTIGLIIGFGIFMLLSESAFAMVLVVSFTFSVVFILRRNGWLRYR